MSRLIAVLSVALLAFAGCTGPADGRLFVALMADDGGDEFEPAAKARAAATGSNPPAAIGWDDLKPASAREEVDPFASMSEEQQDALRDIVLARVIAQRGLTPAETLLQRLAVSTEKLRARGIDIDGLLAQREAMLAQRTAASEKGVAALDGREVRITGYLLPAQVEGQRVTAFLLVPWVGACSHTAPPPPNQIVRVRPDPPYAVERWFEPVEIAGTLRIALADSSLYLVDGSMTVRSTYAIDAAAVRAAPR